MPGEIDVFAREVFVPSLASRRLPFLVYMQGENQLGSALWGARVLRQSLTRRGHRKRTPHLVPAGGPGFESPRPTEANGW